MRFTIERERKHQYGTYVSGNKKYICMFTDVHLFLYLLVFVFVWQVCGKFYNSSGIWTSPFLAMRKTLIYIYPCIYACETNRYIHIHIHLHTCTSLYASGSHWAIRSCSAKVLNFYTFPLSEQSEPMSKRKTVYIRGYCSYDDKTIS